MISPVATFWRGPLDPLRQLCLRSQLAAGHRVTVYSFEQVNDLPRGVINADAATILPSTFAERLRPPEPDGSWRYRTVVQFSDFFRMRLMAAQAGLWLDADVLLLRPIITTPGKAFMVWESALRIGNSALYLPPDDPIVVAFEAMIERDDLMPDWPSRCHRLRFTVQRMVNRSARFSDMRLSVYGPPLLTASARRLGRLGEARPKRTLYAVHGKPELFFDPSNFFPLIEDSAILGFHISAKKRSYDTPRLGSLHAWAAAKFAGG